MSETTTHDWIDHPPTVVEQPFVHYGCECRCTKKVHLGGWTQCRRCGVSKGMADVMGWTDCRATEG